MQSLHSVSGARNVYSRIHLSGQKKRTGIMADSSLLRDLVEANVIRLGQRLWLFLNAEMSVVVAKTLFKAGLHFSAGLSPSPERKLFSAFIAANRHFRSLVPRHVSSPPRYLLWTGS